ncbi:MAG: helix-turn-helix domain-containing protein [Marinifilaceae bacterium]|nr:helix-turn-helix domain-containing protein [Marinifilaceae bacterium]
MEEMASRLEKLEGDINAKADVCSSGGSVTSFPATLRRDFMNFGIGLIVCIRGGFHFTVSAREYMAVAGETVFIPEGKVFRVICSSDDLEIGIIIYKIEPIRDVLGNMVHAVHLYYKMSPDSLYVWKTGDEKAIVDYISLIGQGSLSSEDYFSVYGRKLLLLSLTYRLCTLFQKRYLSGDASNARRTEIFLRLLQFIDRYYMSERGVAFYADKLCLSPKYLSELSKSVCGYTVQELVFKAIIRKCMSYLDGTNMTIQEISEELNFPNPSSFGTFFKKHTGLSPQKYRDRTV